MEAATAPSIQSSAPQQPSMMPTGYAPPAAYQQQPSVAPMPAGVPSPQMPYGAPQQAQAPSEWQVAYNNLVGSQGAPTQIPQISQPWAAPSPMTQPTLSSAQAANWGPQGFSSQVASAPQTWQLPQMPAYLAPQAYQVPQYQMPPAMAPMAQPPAALQQPAAAPAVADRYISSISNESLELLQHFGPEAPYKLNDYSCKVEDALLESLDAQVDQARQLAEYNGFFQQATNLMAEAEREHDVMKTLLTDPQQLSSYVQYFFGPNGPYPTQTPGEEARARLEQGMVPPGGTLLPQSDARAMEFPMEQLYAQREAEMNGQYSRPQMYTPTPTGYSNGPSAQQVWGAFSEAMDTNPAEAWKILNYATPDAVRSKVLFMEG